MEGVERWVVTYVKHLTRKRKVYQDGSLELHRANGKVILLNDCGEVLESKFLKKGEVVESGGTMGFAAFLVEVGEPESRSGPLTELNNQDAHKVSTGEPCIRANFARFGNKNSVLPKIRAQQNCATLLQRRETGNALAGSAVNDRPNATSITVKEWSVLYTAQLTQKAKKYHDGMVKLSLCGFQQKQVRLYDDCGKLLSSKFLKKDEVVESGGVLQFDAYLVEIGDIKESAEPLIGFTVQGEPNKSFVNTCMERQKTGHGSSDGNSQTRLKSIGAADDNPVPVGNSASEWCVMYTTQITQKAKKYHDGILKLSFCGSHTKQITLLDEDGTILATKLLLSSDKVRSGNTLQLANFLVDIGEQVGRVELQRASFSGNAIASKTSSPDRKSQTTDGWVSKNKTLRNAGEILSVLKKPVPRITVDLADPKSVDKERSKFSALLGPCLLESGLRDWKQTPRGNDKDDCPLLFCENDPPALQSVREPPFETATPIFDQECSEFSSKLLAFRGNRLEISTVGACSSPGVDPSQCTDPRSTSTCTNFSDSIQELSNCLPENLLPAALMFSGPASNINTEVCAIPDQSGSSGHIFTETPEKFDKVQNSADGSNKGSLEEASSSSLTSNTENPQVCDSKDAESDCREESKSMEETRFHVGDIPSFDMGF